MPSAGVRRACQRVLPVARSTAKTWSEAFTKTSVSPESTGLFEISLPQLKRQMSPPSAPDRVHRAVVRAEVHDVELGVVERLALHHARRLEAPDAAAVERAER